MFSVELIGVFNNDTFTICWRYLGVDTSDLGICKSRRTVCLVQTIHVRFVHLVMKLAEQQLVGRWARTREYETPKTMKTNCIDKTIKSTIVLSCA